MEISVLCKVVDNFGDIGTVWRLCKKLKTIEKNLKINLIVDDLSSFKKICPIILENKNFQIINEINIYNCNNNDFCYEEFSKKDGEKLKIILECFQCGRPSWLEKILFEDKLNRTVQIIMIDYLTAEKYAEDFHCLKSLTRSAKVQKVNFMPGFTNKTGGLIIDDELQNRNKSGDVLLFAYEKNWIFLMNAINKWAKNQKDKKILLAQGKGLKSLEKAYKNLPTKNFEVEVLDFLSQEDWDKMLKNCSVLFVRGEDSMSRACLNGIPFIWQAYPQSDEYQTVKVNALLQQMKNYFCEKDFEIISNAWKCVNEEKINENDAQKSLFDFFENADNLEKGFYSFALELRKNGNLCEHLLSFVRKNCIINK